MNFYILLVIVVGGLAVYFLPMGGDSKTPEQKTQDAAKYVFASPLAGSLNKSTVMVYTSKNCSSCPDKINKVEKKLLGHGLLAEEVFIDENPAISAAIARRLKGSTFDNTIPAPFFVTRGRMIIYNDLAIDQILSLNPATK